MSAGLGRYRVVFYLSRWICPDDLGLVSQASYCGELWISAYDLIVSTKFDDGIVQRSA